MQKFRLPFFPTKKFSKKDCPSFSRKRRVVRSYPRQNGTFSALCLEWWPDKEGPESAVGILDISSLRSLYILFLSLLSFFFFYFFRKRVRKIRASKISAGSAICPQQVTKIISLAHVSFSFLFFFLREIYTLFFSIVGKKIGGEERIMRILFYPRVIFKSLSNMVNVVRNKFRSSLSVELRNKLRNTVTHSYKLYFKKEIMLK